MSSQPSIKDCYARYYLGLSLRNFVVNVLPMPFMFSEDQPPSAYRSKMSAVVLKLSDSLGMDKLKISRALSHDLREMAASAPLVLDEPSRKSARKKSAGARRLASMIYRELEELRIWLNNHPNSLAKARIALESLLEFEIATEENVRVPEVLLLLPRSQAEKYVKPLRTIWANQRAEMKERDQIGYDHGYKMFWNHGHHNIADGISHYRVAESFNIGGFEESFTGFEDLVASSLIDDQGVSSVRRISFDLILASRSTRLVSKVDNAIGIALKNIIREFKGKCWVELNPHDFMKEIPSVETTAYATLALMRVGQSDQSQEFAKRAVDWLLEHQNRDGSWDSDVIRPTGHSSKSDLFVNPPPEGGGLRFYLTAFSPCKVY